MKTITQQYITKLEVEKSTFIGIVVPLSSKDEIKNIMNRIKKDYPNARHYCYALNTIDYSKSSDDGEPSGTAGRPLLELLKRNDIVNDILVIVRYFGGVKLGKGRLLRTYSQTGENTLQSAEIKEMKLKYLYEAKTNYANINALEQIIKTNNLIIDKKEFGDEVSFLLLSDDEINSPYKDISFIFIQKQWSVV